MYIVLVDRRLWTSGTVSGQGADPQDRNESDSNQQLEPKDKETSLDDNEEGEFSKSSNAVIVWIFAIEGLCSKLFLKFSPHPTLHRLMHFSQTFQTPFFFYSPPNKPDNASDIFTQGGKITLTSSAVQSPSLAAPFFFFHRCV